MDDWAQVVGKVPPELISTFVVSALMLILNYRISRRLERYKIDLALQVANERARLEESVLRRSSWYDRRAIALIDLYGAFYAYLDFLRLHLYFDRQGRDITPVQDFRRACDSLSVFLTDDLKRRVDKYCGELLEFWSWSVENRESEQEEIRRRLDHEIPQYLERLRVDISRYLEERPLADQHENTG